MINIAKITFIFLSFFAKIALANTPPATYHHNTVWSRLAFEKNLKKFDIKLEMDYRQQNDFRKAGFNPLAVPFLRWYRINTSYKTGKFTHSIILPNQIKTFPLAATTADLTRPIATEWRYSVLEEYRMPYKKTTSAIRLAYELRCITNNEVLRSTSRYRFRLQENYKLNPKSAILASYELLYNGEPNKAANTFSQSQLHIKYNHTFGKNLSLITGINRMLRKRDTLVEYDLENAIICQVIYKL